MRLHYKSVEKRTTQVHKKRADVWILQWKSQKRMKLRDSVWELEVNK